MAFTDGLPRGRVVSIDALRGFDMFWIIGGGAIAVRLCEWIDTPLALALSRQFHHADWHGFNFEDLIFPLFLFIVGASMPFSITRRLDRGQSKRDIYLHIVRRTAVLLLLGFIYNGILGFDFAHFRFAGVLQRIALGYFFAAIIVMNTDVRGQAAATGLILLLYWAAMALVPVPGYGAGDYSPAGNLAVYVDFKFLPGRLNHYGESLYGDTTGLLTTVPAVASTLLGVLSGHLIRGPLSGGRKAGILAASGVVSILAALIFNIVFPINKHLWSSSFVLLAGGWSLLLFALFYWIIDVRGIRSWAFPFVVIGMNAITIYVAQRLFGFDMVAGAFIGGVMRYLGGFGPVSWVVSVLAVKWLFLYFLYRRKIFLKV